MNTLSCFSHVKRSINNKRPLPPFNTDVVLIVDRSGSMSSVGDSIAEGTSSWMRNQYNSSISGGNVYMEVVTFDSYTEIPFSGNVKTIIESDYEYAKFCTLPRGATKLYDTAIEAILRQRERIKNRKKKFTKHEKRLDKKISGVIALITDGYDNRSKKYNSNDLKKLVLKHRKEGNICQFIAGNMVAEDVGVNLGFEADLCLTMDTDPIHTKMAMRAISSSTQRAISNYSTPKFTKLERYQSSSL